MIGQVDGSSFDKSVPCRIIKPEVKEFGERSNFRLSQEGSVLECERSIRLDSVREELRHLSCYFLGAHRLQTTIQ
jgi:hypothetical protein